MFVTGAPAEKQVVQTVVETVRNARCQALMLPLLSAAAAISGAKFVLTPDTATVHIASAAGVPVVGLYATLRSIAEWYPYQSPFALLLSPNEGSINQIPIVRVSDAIEKLCEETQLCKKQARRLETQDIQPIL
ncbi:MAG: glycosyltransferase family 9 protein [Chloroherpetonaceae bacterium]|nr:glycosyltransferase family 9 protein [Chloroherpetonaceae bacterium]